MDAPFLFADSLRIGPHHTQERVITDGHTSYLRAVRAHLGRPCAASDEQLPQQSPGAKSLRDISNGIIPCTVSETLTLLPVSSVLLMNDEITFTLAIL